MVDRPMSLVEQCVIVGEKGIADTEVLATDVGHRVPKVRLL